MNNFETVRIDLPSKGKVYSVESPLSLGYVEMRYMTAKHEDILTNPNNINKGWNYAVNEFAKSLIVTEGFEYGELIEGDSFQILIASRILSYGEKYHFEYDETPYTIDLSQLPDKELNWKLFKNKNEFPLHLTISDATVCIKLLTVKDLSDIDIELKELNKKFPDENFNRYVKLKKMLVSVDGDYSEESIINFIDNKLIGWDIRDIFDFYKKISPDVDFTFKTDTKEGTVKNIPFSPIEMFFPDTKL